MIELSGIQEHELSKLAGFAVNPQAQRLGYSSKKQYKLERDLSLAVIKGKCDILWLAERYSNSYVSSGTPTVNQYRDYLISLLLVAFVKDFQYYERSTALTNHAKKVWSHYDYKQIWPYIPVKGSAPKIYAWGPLGSLSFFSYYSPKRDTYSEDTWLNQIEDCLRLIWLSVGQSFDVRSENSVSANERLKRFFGTVGLTEEFLELVTELFKVTHKENSVSRRRRGETSNELDLVKQRILFNEYPETLYLEALAVAPDKLKADLTQVNDRLRASLKPVGLRLLLQAIVVERLYKSVVLLTQLPESWKSLPLVTYLKTSYYADFGADDVKEQMVKNWVTISDAQYLQVLFNNPPVSYKESKNLYLWQSAVKDLDTSLDSPFRLNALL